MSEATVQSANQAGKTAIVTGASSGIGRAIAEQLGCAGAFVYLTGRKTPPMLASKALIEKAGGKAEVVAGDICDVTFAQGLISTALQHTGRLDIMVNNAGLEHPAKIMDGDPEHWRIMLETNVLAVLVGCQAAVAAMRQCAAEGHIVNISSVSAQRSNSGVYGATKHAVNVISASLRDELENDTIRVTNVMPGATATNFGRNFDQEFVQKITQIAGMEHTPVDAGQHLPEEVLIKLTERAKQLLSDPNDIAKAVLYAVSQPIDVNLAEIVVRPPRAMTLAH